VYYKDMKIYIAADHAGFELKEKLLAYLAKLGYDAEDAGDTNLDPSDDYPQFAYQAVVKVLGEDDGRGILVCGSGQGMCIAANRMAGIRASLCWNEESARETREDNDSNVLCLPARMIDQAAAMKITEMWLQTPFSKATRHMRRLREIEELFG
jgi:ribose 5-phosphate isomerase B